MTSHNKRKSSGSPIIRLLSLPGKAIERFAWRFCKVNRCDTDGQNIVLHKGPFTARTIAASEIMHWSVHPEMGFDLVSIELANGEALTWIDEYNDLLDSLRKLAGPKETSSNEE